MPRGCFSDAPRVGKDDGDTATDIQMASHLKRIAPAAGALAIALSLASPAAAADGAIGALEDDGRYGAFVAAARASGLAEVLSASSEGRTIFAPTDEAFARLPDALVARLARSTEEALRDLIARHIVPEGPYRADELPGRMTNLAGGSLEVRGEGGVTVNAGGGAARVVAPGIEAENVLVHGIDRVLFVARQEGEPMRSGRRNVDGQDFVDAIAAVDEDRQDGPLVPETEEPFGSATTVGEDDTLTLSADDITVIALGDRRDSASGFADAGEVITLPPEAEAPMLARLQEEAEPPGNARPPSAAGAAAAAASDAGDAPERETRNTGREGAAAATEANEEPALDLSRETLSVADLLGRDVRDPSGERLGEVEDVRLSLRTGAATRIVVEMDTGFLGLFDRTTSVDPDSVAIDPLDGAVIVERSALEQEGEGE